METNEAIYIKQSLALIEERLKWGPVQSWANYDFEKLSSAIEEKTSVVLSVTTLKRIWGRVKYTNSPTLTTLNTLARFLDHEDWRSFVASLPVADEVTPPVIEDIPPVQQNNPAPFKKRSPFSIPVSVATLLFVFAVSFLIFSGRKNAARYPVDPRRFQFEADKIISEGVPNTVIFTYDAKSAPSDSVYIVQTWDIRRKTLVSRLKNKHSAIYYYPGFFRTKLIIDSTIVKTHDLQISTDGWLCLVETGPVPFYFNKNEFTKKDCVEIDKTILAKSNIALNPVPPKIRFFNQRDLGDLMNDNFIFETTLKNAFSEGANQCQYVEVLIQCKDDIIIIPLAAKPCTGDMFLYACGKTLNSKEADLSGFGANLHEWTKLRVETKNKEMHFFVNDTPAASFAFPHDPTGIVGVQYRFNGVGAVRDTWFEGNGRKIVMR